MIKFRIVEPKEFCGKKLEQKMPYPIQYGTIEVDGVETRYLDVFVFDDDLRQVDTEINGEGIATYEKRNTKEVTETIDGVEVTKTIDVWNDYDPTQLFAGIQAVIDAQDPTAAEKAAAIEEARTACNERILSGFTSSCLGTPKMFDCSMTDQATIQGLVITAMLGLQGATSEECWWKGTGELECYKFTYEQIIQLGMDMKNHIQDNIAQFNAKRLIILNSNIN